MSHASHSPLRCIPGIGPSMTRALNDLEIYEISDLLHRDPETMYARLCELRASHMDRCVLYVFRCAVYYANHTEHDPDLLKWWNWKDAVGTPANGGR